MFYDLLLFPSKISESVICHNFSIFQVLFLFFFSFFQTLTEKNGKLPGLIYFFSALTVLPDA